MRNDLCVRVGHDNVVLASCSIRLHGAYRFLHPSNIKFAREAIQFLPVHSTKTKIFVSTDLILVQSKDQCLCIYEMSNHHSNDQQEIREMISARDDINFPTKKQLDIIET
mmetsp:Transcript_5441/g.11125  ORF Transcript_5441/g.11125 Transcript_5441/m.11125 type:complete len:110 (+) Transcript_5441:277-606(+)